MHWQFCLCFLGPLIETGAGDGRPNSKSNKTSRVDPAVITKQFKRISKERKEERKCQSSCNPSGKEMRWPPALCLNGSRQKWNGEVRATRKPRLVANFSQISCLLIFRFVCSQKLSCFCAKSRFLAWFSAKRQPILREGAKVSTRFDQQQCQP